MIIFGTLKYKDKITFGTTPQPFNIQNLLLFLFAATRVKSQRFKNKHFPRVNISEQEVVVKNIQIE